MKIIQYSAKAYSILIFFLFLHWVGYKTTAGELVQLVLLKGALKWGFKDTVHGFEDWSPNCSNSLSASQLTGLYVRLHLNRC